METVIGTILKDPPKDGQVGQWALTVAVLILAVLIGWQIKKIDQNTKDDSARSAEFRKAMAEQAAEFRKAQAEHVEETERRFAEHAERMACIERDYLPRETHYKDIGGWRTDMNDMRNNLGDEIRGVRQDVNSLIPSLIKIAMQGAKNGD